MSSYFKTLRELRLSQPSRGPICVLCGTRRSSRGETAIHLESTLRDLGYRPRDARDIHAHPSCAVAARRRAITIAQRDGRISDSPFAPLVKLMETHK
jgi:hypothetical protein